MRIKRTLYVLICVLLCLPLFVSACDSDVSNGSQELTALPPPERDGGPFGVDVNINMTTIDDWLERPDVVYFDMRMLYDPANYEEIGGISRLTQTLPGYRIVPFPFIATLSALPVDGRYEGDSLFTVDWGEERGQVLSISPNFAEAEFILSDIFPKDKAIFLMCGGAGYTSLARGLLVHMGWDENLIYHTGGMWHYEGNKAIDLTIPGAANPNVSIATWRANYTFIDFDHLTRLNP